MLKWGTSRGLRDEKNPEFRLGSNQRQVPGGTLRELLAPRTRGLGLGTLSRRTQAAELCFPAPPPPHITSLPLSGNCVPSPCHNGGTCLEEEEGVRCLCLPGYGGDLCDVGECVGGTGVGGGRSEAWTLLGPEEGGEGTGFGFAVDESHFRQTT